MQSTGNSGIFGLEENDFFLLKIILEFYLFVGDTVELLPYWKVNLSLSWSNGFPHFCL